MVRAVEYAQVSGLDTAVGFEPEVASGSVGSEWLYREGSRLDAGYYNAETMQAHIAMASSGWTMKPLREVTERIFIPPRFKRVYVDKAHGVPFLQGTHISQSRPTGLKYLSRSAHKNLHRWVIEAGWVLVTCSGTIGRAAVALQNWDGWAASQHILRVVPKTEGSCPAGYIYAWLSSPLGQAQFNGTYGAVVDELTAEHVESILIPLPETEDQHGIVSSINVLVMDAVAAKEQALKQDALAIDTASRLLDSEAT
jgi:type I restriction enzyme S subunit